MTERPATVQPAPPGAPPPAPAGEADGVRITRTPFAARDLARGAGTLAVAAILVAGAWALLRPAAAPAPTGAGARDSVIADRTPASTAERIASVHAERAAAAPRAARAAPSAPDIGPDDLPGHDPTDLASYVSPDDPEPTMREVIQALHDAGDHTGLGAFNPPGTSPPLRGLAVPPDFELPPGYVRHHQVTDEGEPLEPILMFSPDASPRDAAGNELALPEDLVVPAHLAPPGLPIREIDIPPRP